MGLLGNLRAPTGLGPGIIAFALGKTKLEQEFNQINKMQA